MDLYLLKWILDFLKYEVFLLVVNGVLVIDIGCILCVNY